MNSFILSYMLKYADSYEYIEKFCFKNKNLCNENKNTVCKKILKISGYTNVGGNSCLIYKELAQKARQIPKTNGHSYIQMTPELLELCQRRCSIDLMEFLEDNGYNIDSNSASNVSNTSSDLHNKNTLISEF